METAFAQEMNARFAATRTVAVIPCCAAKASERCQAEAMYRSPNFALALRAARAACDEVFILSAKHGLISLSDEIAPYDTTFDDDASISTEEVAEQAEAIGFIDADVYTFLPSRYERVLGDALRSIYATWTDAFEGSRGIGDQRGHSSSIANDTTDCDALIAALWS